MAEFNVSFTESEQAFTASFRETPALPDNVYELNVVANGTYNAGEDAAYNPVNVDVPNTYKASDNGKVVQGGQLVEQTATTFNSNGTYNTTTNDSVTVDVPAPQEKDVNFIDYDGTILYSFTAEEFATMEALPANPSHTGLTAQGWNWSLADAKDYVAAYGKLWVGQNYITSDGKTRFYISLPDGKLSTSFGIGLDGSATIAWGDGAESTITGSDADALISASHTYAAVGNYVIALSVTGQAAFLADANRLVSYKSAITQIEIGANVSLHASCFYALRSLTSVSIPQYITNIPDYCFQNCFSLRSVTISSGANSVGQNVFYSCRSLETISFPDSVNSVSTSAFNGCYSLKSVTLPRSLTAITNSLFYNCYSLKDIVIPVGVKSIGGSVFYNDAALQNIVIPNSCTSIAASTFFTCSSLKSAVIPDSVTTFGIYLFYACDSLIVIKLPSSMTSLVNSFFSGCSSLANITIPKAVTQIQQTVFSACPSLAFIKFERTTPPTVANANAFSGVPTSCIIYVPTGSLNAYKTANNYPDPNQYSYVEY